MASSASERERNAELRRRIQQLQAALAVLEPTTSAVAASESSTEEVTLEALAHKVTETERRLLGRFNAAEKFLLNQLDEQLLGTIMIVGLFLVTAFYVFYFLMENLLRLRRCRCPDVSPENLNLMIRAAKYQCSQQEQQEAATAAPAAPVAAPVRTVVVEACSVAH